MATRREFLRRTCAATLMASAAPIDEGDTKEKSTQTRRARHKGSVLDLAIVGTGDISPRYLSQAAKSQRARFIATCARTLESAKARANEYHIPRWFDDYIAMYDVVSPDAVVIATPNSIHAAPTIAALERGIHVLCEKPMATTWAECQAVVAAARRSGAVLLCLPYEGHPGPLAALRYLNEPTLGIFTGAEAQLFLRGYDRERWYDARLTGGITLDALVYCVSELINMLGPLSRVTGFINTLAPKRVIGRKTVETAIDDNVTLIGEWSTGQMAIFRAMLGPATERGETIIYGHKGALWLRDSDLVIHSPSRVIPGADPTSWGSYKDCYRVPVQGGQSYADEGLLEHLLTV